MDRVLQGLRWSRCLVYLDDIISFGTTFENALDNLTLIFERLRSYGLQLKSTNKKNHRPATTTRLVISPPVNAGMELIWISLMSATPPRRVFVTS